MKLNKIMHTSGIEFSKRENPALIHKITSYEIKGQYTVKILTYLEYHIYFIYDIELALIYVI